MAVDSNFERLEEKLTHLVDVLGQLRQENTDLKTHVTALETENSQLKSASERLQRLEEESQEEAQNREEVKGLYRALLGKIRAEGYDHSELLSEDIKFVNDGCVIYRITFTRWKKDGSFMPPQVRGSVCTMLKVDGQWGLSNVALETGTGD